MTDLPSLYVFDRLNGVSDLRVDPLTEFSEWKTDAYCPGPAPTCPVCGGYIGMLTWLPPFEVELESWSKVYGDFVFGPGYEFLISHRFKVLYEEHGLTGLSGFEPVTVKRVIRRRGGRADPPNYYRAVVTYARTAIDAAASELEGEKPPSQICPECRECSVKRWKRIVIEPETFSGEDIAIPRGKFMYLVTERFKTMVEQHRLSNARTIPIENFAHDYYPWEHGQS